MTQRTRIFIGILLIYAAGIASCCTAVGDIDPRYRESAEESLVETSQLMAALVEQDVGGGALRADALEPLFRSVYARHFSAEIYSVDKTRVELRMTSSTAQGKVVFDSRAATPAGAASGAASATRRRRRSVPITRTGTTSASLCAAATARAPRPTSRAIRGPR